VIEREVLHVLPLPSVTVSRTVKLPGPAYVCEALRVGGDVVTAGEPSPKSKRNVVIAERLDVEPDPSACTVSGALDEVCSVSRALSRLRLP
jgi:hypothetical protein